MIRLVMATGKTSNLALIGRKRRNNDAVRPNTDSDAERQAADAISVAQLSSHFSEYEDGIDRLRRLNVEMRQRLGATT